MEAAIKIEMASKLRPWCEELKASVRREAATFEERTILAAEAFRQTEGEPFRILRTAHATSHILGNMPIQIREGEILAGWHPNTHPDDEMKQALQEANGYLRKQNYWVGASEGHMAPDFPTILELGLGGIKEKIVQMESSLDMTDPQTPEKRAFYRAARTSLEAFSNVILRYAELARTAQKEAEDYEWRDELGKIVEICEHISTNPPRTFREAIQLSWFTFLAVAVENSTHHHCFGLGHIDRYLLSFYLAEKEAGTLNEEEADALLDQLFIKYNEFSGPGMSALIIGIAGRNPDGSDATNELSYKCLESSDRVGMYFPGVDVLWHKDIDEDFMRAACGLLRNGVGHPAFFNSDVIVKGLTNYGVPFEHAVEHLPSTCTETSIQGRSNPWVAHPYVNIPMDLLYAMFNGRHPISGKQDRPANGFPAKYDELKKAFFKQVEYTAHQAIASGIQNQLLESWYRPFPLLSCFIQDCIGRGKDISHGGALHNFLQPEAVGISNVVDGLAAIKTLVEDEKRYTLDDFRNAVTKNFEGYEELRQAILRECPKYGNNTPWINELFAEVAGGWCSAIEGHRNFYGGPVFPGFLGWVVWIGFGQNTPATPDGRLAETPLANTVGPCTGVQLKGAPSMFMSSCELDQSRGLGGITFNLRFSSNSLKDELGVERLKSLIETVFDLGIYQIQVNLTSSEVLKDAQEKPENYPDLLVRIGGYLVPFTLLPKEAQEDVIARTEIDL
ncbi:hypothetical protein H8E77_13635 [bacterium]|nr:hypothetical protein [bacterium]